ncbi:MAG: hypothetical protein HOP13_09150 [Alphaproteobacteria bacterium]|nr:hypothetical protein [Alphaproteobacteria bacterium]
MSSLPIRISAHDKPGAFETEGWPTITLPAIAVVRATERAIDSFYSSTSPEPAQVCLDMSRVKYLEIASLQVMTAFLAMRHRSGLVTKIRLPAGEDGLKVRHFLRRWEYPKALHSVTGKRFDFFVDRQDLRYFSGAPGTGDTDNPYSPTTVRYSTKYGEVVYTKDSYRFFGFRSWQLSDRADKAAVVEDEQRRWKEAERVVAETLRRKLIVRNADKAQRIEPERYLASRVVLQAMTNALRHPRASVLQASSHMTQAIADQRLVDTSFTLVYWDDGIPMHATLREALDEEKPIIFKTANRATYLVVYKNSDNRVDRIRVARSDEIPSKQTSEEDLLLSTLFPGVTCDVTGQNRLSPSDLERDDLVEVPGDGLLDIPGHGLFMLVEVAVELLQGSVSFRCGDLFMNVSPLSDAAWRRLRLEGQKPPYRVKIQRRSGCGPRFLGNMVTVRLPLEHQGA